ncbi:ATP-binding cassette sub-family F member 3 [Arthroderma uncinatum]|uniref:ATP-binding cassette sub-family F member 3 n=1 Tax=Arthroderma uncinatum TaxID=74035 RepID=UPI00144AE36B|nr:ATP-binding cassette sub-family F member 3 [Arthroderma uncinatum]KAF3481102.1 ATP-binding cassette sub-family F member 3 [Arthroderma uncinatum]
MKRVFLMASSKQDPVILATCKQTRFHLAEGKGSGEIDIQGLDIQIASRSSQGQDAEASGTGKSKARKKDKSGSGLEILNGATLRLKAGVHYGLVGRNGTGKSTLLRAMADRLIPGLPESVGIAILQQTDIDVDPLTLVTRNAAALEVGEVLAKKEPRTVLQQVVQSDKARNEITRKLKILSQALEGHEDSLAPVKAIRHLRHEARQHELFLAQKNASLRSGARGLQARKDLKMAESKVEESAVCLEEDLTALDNSKIQEETQAAVELLADVEAQFESINVLDLDQEARKVLLGLGFKEADLDQPFFSLSGGWRMRCMLAGALIQSADIMILDEPTNFLDMLGVIWLETYLTRMRELSDKTVVVVSHDREFLNNICEEIIILKDKTLTYFKGNVSAYEQDQESQKLYWGRMKEAQERQVAHMENTIKTNTKIGKKTGDDNKLRMAKSRQKKLDDRMGVEVSASGGRFKLSRDRAGWHDSLRAEIEVPADEKGVSIYIPDAPDLRFPGPLLSLEGVAFQYKRGGAVVLKSIDLVMHMGDRVGILGLNGCGKSTLLKLFVGSEEPTQGKISRHPRLKLGYYSQHSVEELQELGQSAPAETGLSLLCKETEGVLEEGEVRGLLSSLGLPGRTASDVPVCQLSGGQLVRLALARILWQMPHILVLDEITTHLDFHTVLALAAALSSYNGALLLVSHDRYLVRKVIEGKQNLDDDDGAELEAKTHDEGDESKRRDVVVLKAGRLQLQEDGVDQFEASLQKRVRKMIA